jgi:hypothetical protein
MLMHYEFECCGARLNCQGAIDNAGGIATILRAVGGVNLVVHFVRLDEENIFLDATHADVRFVAFLGGADPGGGVPVHGSDVEIATLANNPDGHRLS